ncbi:uncharacterized protein Z518_01917 [Rhinocladiella mackenziei CBS 650.93]|uniref:SWR1-complex protein 5 n=1 Tax=Rhinocladiella mackenziei CBS 650.93 TaxID=1442369 RepID=A0A0D2IN60_9EURO|nr:uncharacterized protein Z518_01917 [Rhinocladiella mackenziei CBS 650.93]KIX07264.1 hypothetical protein Z518_01917 [Rhinocladiella mackenziei CBS 650.93]
MVSVQDPDVEMEDDYDEEADSDFQEDDSGAEDATSSSDEEDQKGENVSHRPLKRRKVEKAQEEKIVELDSGDEATINEQKKTHRKQKKPGFEELDDSGNESERWRARTRAMRVREKDERRRSKLASIKGSTVDVDKIWEEMNRPGPLPPPRLEGDTIDQKGPPKGTPGSTLISGDVSKENVPATDAEETITIKRTYKFAGEVHVEEKTVLKSSAEAQLWLSQQQSKSETSAPGGKVVHRPLRKISRFDPNFSNLDAFKASWALKNVRGASFKGPKLNVVEKSKMDWAVHVDTEGLKEELDTHAKAKEGYLNRMDFLKGVEERKEAEARAARLNGR